MRVVIAPFNRMNDATLADVRAAGHEVLCTGTEALTYAEIAAQYPEGWLPDVFIFWSPEYYPIPDGLETAPCFKVGVFGDWNLGGQAVQQAAGVFDLLFADAAGVRHLRALGCRNVVSAALWSFDPSLHRCLPGVERDLDIVLIGNFNHEIQQERARWLGRVAKLSTRYEVCLTSGVHGEAYTTLMNRAKIVFNRSIRGEINMRAYEATACGALLFYERENREIRSLYTDGRECVLYGDDDLEPLLDFYLTHDAERRAIAEAGTRRVRNETPSRHILDMFGAIERDMAGRPLSRVNPFAVLPACEKELRRARQWLLSTDIGCLRAADIALGRAELGGADPAAAARLRGYVLAQSGQYLPGADRDSAWIGALRHWRRAVEIDPDCAAGRLNLASMLIETGCVDEAENNLKDAYAALLRQDDGCLRPGELFWPCRFTAFGVELERIEMSFPHGSADWNADMRRLLLWRVTELLSDLAFASARYIEAEMYARAGGERCPELAATRPRHARALHALGRVDEAVAAYRAALVRNPFLVEARTSLVRLLIDIEQGPDAILLLDDWSAIIGACPPYRAHLAECERLRTLAQAACPPAGGEVSRPRRLLAFPDWSSPRSWQAVIAAFAGRGKREPELLMLWAGGSACADPAALLRGVAAFLHADLGLSPAAFPEVTILAQQLEPEDRWKLFYVADAVLDAGAIPTEFKDVFEASGMWTMPIAEAHHLAA